MIRRLVALGALVAVLAPAPAVHADDVAEARARFRSGAAHYAAKRYREAIEEFEAAYRLKPHGAIHYNVAQCRERLGEWPGAIRAYHDYLREVPDANDRASVEASIARLEARLATSGVQVLIVYSEPPGADVRVDGHPRGRTPVHVVLPPGAYDLALSLDGRAPASQQVTLRADASRVVEVDLRSAPATSSPSPSPTATPTAIAIASSTPNATSTPTPTATAVRADLSAPHPASAPLPPVPAPPRASANHRLWTWVAAGAGALAVGAGAYYGVTAAQRSADLRDGTVRSASASTALRDDAVSRQRRANVLYAVGGVAGAAGATLFFVEGRF